MAKILIVYASKHGSTKDVVNFIAATLKQAEHELHVYDKPSTAPAPIGYDAVILGSAVYFGRWMGVMQRYCKLHSFLLAGVPSVWLFSTGPVGGQDNLAYNTPVPVDVMRKERNVKDHIVFSGKLTQRNLSFVERTATKFVKAEPGDYRNWSAVNDWAQTISTSLEVT